MSNTPNLLKEGTLVMFPAKTGEQDYIEGYICGYSPCSYLIKLKNRLEGYEYSCVSRPIICVKEVFEVGV